MSSSSSPSFRVELGEAHPSSLRSARPMASRTVDRARSSSPVAARPSPARLGPDSPSLTFAAIDFETQTLADGLRQAGFRTAEPAFFSRLGVIVYLTHDAATRTLKFVASLPTGTEIVFDYAIAPSALSESDRRVHDDTRRVVAVRGEPWLSYFAPRTLAAELRAAGFNRVEDLGPDEIQERYFKGRPDGLCVNGLARLVKAGR